MKSILLDEEEVKEMQVKKEAADMAQIPSANVVQKIDDKLAAQGYNQTRLNDSLFTNMVLRIYDSVDFWDKFFNKNLPELTEDKELAEISGSNYNKEANYYSSKNLPYANKFMPSFIENRADVATIELYDENIHMPEVVGGSKEDYDKAKAAVTKFKRDKGLLQMDEVRAIKDSELSSKEILLNAKKEIEEHSLELPTFGEEAKSKSK